MIIKVHMLAFSDDKGVVREVEIPQEEYDRAKSAKEILELVFKYGQNDFQTKSMYSVSVGDVVEIHNHYYMVMSTGFDELTKEEFDGLQPPTSFSAYQKSIKNSLKE